MYDYQKEERKAYIGFIVKLMKNMSIQKLRDVLEYILKIYDK